LFGPAGLPNYSDAPFDGASRAGRLVLDRLRGFDVRLLLADPYLDPRQARALGAQLVDTDQLCRDGDLLRIHAPALPETHHLLDARRLGLLRDGATLVNSPRVPCGHRSADKHYATGRIAAVLDVTPRAAAARPSRAAPAQRARPSHLAGSQGHELRRFGELAVAEVAHLVGGEPLHGVVHASELSRVA
jgi:phosphoglycerate dehydrogenase-like enzyme